ncbi:TPA: hypothetical protein HA245_08235, partial [Candidatus Woesearchaeota archaeon]|nr:hypothetical protein [Candidatus Woesearchaeota archaeon]HIH48307.1 hypothetical protein [Candidatus Woesearchaeota archaeon]HIJ03809.1 hypothetical protein [Candidatus Woesearchaeota archaeon]
SETRGSSHGVKFSGDGAHKELIDHALAGFDESSREFIQKMREYRNRIAYEGFND